LPAFRVSDYDLAQVLQAAENTNGEAGQANLQAQVDELKQVRGICFLFSVVALLALVYIRPCQALQAAETALKAAETKLDEFGSGVRTACAYGEHSLLDQHTKTTMLPRSFSTEVPAGGPGLFHNGQAQLAKFANTYVPTAREGYHMLCYTGIVDQKQGISGWEQMSREDQLASLLVRGHKLVRSHLNVDDALGQAVGAGEFTVLYQVTS
jgi:hypothetical protein